MKDKSYLQMESNADRPLVSIILSVKNEERYIEECIESITSIEHSYECIVVDDHSDDNTYQIVLKVSDKNQRVRLFKNPEKGKISAFNFGFSKATGFYIQLTGGDDFLLDSYNALLSRAEKSGREKVFIFTLNIFDDKSKSVTGTIPIRINKRWKNNIRYFISNPIASYLIPYKIASSAFPIPKNVPYEDSWINQNIFLQNPEFEVVPLCCYNYRQHDQQTFGRMNDATEDTIQYRARRVLRYLTSVKENAELLRQKYGDNKVDYLLRSQKCVNFYNLFYSEKKFRYYLLIYFTCPLKRIAQINYSILRTRIRRILSK